VERKKIMQKIFFAGFLLVSFIYAGLLYAADLKVGVIDIQKIMRESNAAKNARAVFLKDLEAKRNVFNAKQKEVQDLQEEIKNKIKDMSEALRIEKTEKLSKEAKELERLKADLEEELKKKDTELTRKILKEISDVVQEYRRKEKYSIIYEKQTLVSYDEAIDITDKIIKLYDVVK
jgi:outer membrane protein